MPASSFLIALARPTIRDCMGCEQSIAAPPVIQSVPEAPKRTCRSVDQPSEVIFARSGASHSMREIQYLSLTSASVNEFQSEMHTLKPEETSDDRNAAASLFEFSVPLERTAYSVAGLARAMSSLVDTM